MKCFKCLLLLAIVNIVQVYTYLHDMFQPFSHQAIQYTFLCHTITAFCVFVH